LGCSEFARHYFRNHSCFLFLRVLRWFTSPGSPRHPMNSDDANRCSHRLGFPIRTSPDHSLLAASRSLSQLTTSFIACLRQGIHTHALSSLTIKSTSHTTLVHATFFALTNLCLVCPSIFNCQRSIPENSGVRGHASYFWLLTSGFSSHWWAWVELNYRPHPYQGCALAN
jgi:hypothetical protein